MRHFIRPLDFKNGRVDMSHGSGGRAMAQLVDELFLAAFDAERRFGITYKPVADNKACECGAILRGVKRPQDCKLFAKACTPENPMGSCMVSSEGACAAHFTYGRFKDAAA